MLSGKAGSEGWQRTVTFDSDPDICPQKGMKKVTLGLIYMGEREDLMISHPTSLKDPSEMGKKEQILESGLYINLP